MNLIWEVVEWDEVHGECPGWVNWGDQYYIDPKLALNALSSRIEERPDNDHTKVMLSGRYYTDEEMTRNFGKDHEPEIEI